MNFVFELWIVGGGHELDHSFEILWYLYFGWWGFVLVDFIILHALGLELLSIG